jgi:AraC-like DNA-binding protein
MIYARYHAPAPHLRSVIEIYFFYDVRLPAGMTVADRLLGERPNIKFLIEGATQTSTYKRNFQSSRNAIAFGHNTHPISARLTGAARLFGMGITTTGWSTLFDMPLSELTDCGVELSALIGNEAECVFDTLCACTDDLEMVRVMDTFWTKRLAARERRLCPMIRAIEDMVAGRPMRRADELASAVDMSLRNLQRLTADHFGLTPKQLLRRQRFIRTARAMRTLSGTDLDDWLAEDFTDASHLTREFHRFAGETPGQFVARARPIFEPAFIMQSILRRRSVAEFGADGERIEVDTKP